MNEMEEDHHPSPPKTPKRAQECPNADGSASPQKVSRQCEDDEGYEPTNRDLMMFLRNMQDSQSTPLRQLNTRLGEAEVRIARVEDATIARLDNVEAKLESMELSEGADISARARITELEATIRKMDQLFKHIQSNATAASSSTSLAAPRMDDNLVILGGFKRETPRGQLEEVWARQLLKEIEKNVDLRGYEAFCPYMLSSVLFARCPDSSSARSLVSLVRRLNLTAKIKGINYNIWATLQKPKEVKPLESAPVEVGGVLEGFLGADVPQTENWKCVCWSSGTIILNDTRVCKVSHTGGLYELKFCDEWYDNKTFRSGASAIEEGAHKIMKDMAEAEL